MQSIAPHEHYDEEYFLGHYGPLVADAGRYHLLSQHWQFVLERHTARHGIDLAKNLLDYGAGSGVVSAAFSNTACYDTSPWSIEFLAKKNRTVFSKFEDIPRHAFSNLLCSHSLEHYENPCEALSNFRELVCSKGKLLLMLPVERDFTIHLEPDSDQHLFCWNFQTISNLLRLGGWKPLSGKLVYGPFLLNTLGKWFSPNLSVNVAAFLGRCRRNFESMLVVAEKSE